MTHRWRVRLSKWLSMEWATKRSRTPSRANPPLRSVHWFRDQVLEVESKNIKKGIFYYS